jgi:hypothetical protein
MLIQIQIQFKKLSAIVIAIGAMAAASVGDMATIV